MSNYQRKIIHVDMDCFFAAVEMLDNPALKGKPIGVGGDMDRRGVLCTCNYEARKYGVRSAMATSIAKKKCPQLILVPPRMHRYKEISQIVHSIFEEYTDKIQPLSLDEAYLDVSFCKEFQGSATLIAKDIRKKIFEQTGLTASAGVAGNKFLAKVASDMNKPDGLYVIAPKDVDSFILNLDIAKINGVGKVTQAKLHELGVKTCADLQKLSLEKLVGNFGKMGQVLFMRARGIDDSIVSSDSTPKSLSVERTFAQDIDEIQEMKVAMNSIMEEFYFRLKRNKKKLEEKKLSISNFQLKVKYSDFQTSTIETKKNLTLSEFCLNSFEEFFESYFNDYIDLIDKMFERRSSAVRLIGLGVKLTEIKTDQMPLFQAPVSYQNHEIANNLGH